MADLRDIAVGLGFGNVATLINSGNLLYTSTGDTCEREEQLLHDAIAHTLGVRCTVFVRTREQLTEMLDECPLRDEAARDPSRLLVTVWNAGTPRAALESFAATTLTVERFVLGPSALYCWMPDGLSASVPYEKASRALGDHITGRNWSTMRKLLTKLEALA